MDGSGAFLATMPPAAAARHAAVRQALPQGRLTLYGVIDAAVDERLFGLLQAEPVQSQMCCLYSGRAAVRYARHAPYLFAVHAESPLYLRWLDEGWLAHWGILLAGTTVKAEPIQRHLKRFLQATDARGQTVWVRFYDPRVLPDLLSRMDYRYRLDWFGDGLVHTCMVPTPSGLWCATTAYKNTLRRIVGAPHMDARLLPLPLPGSPLPCN